MSSTQPLILHMRMKLNSYQVLLTIRHIDDILKKACVKLLLKFYGNKIKCWRFLGFFVIYILMKDFRH